MRNIIAIALLFSAPCYAKGLLRSEQSPNRYWKALCTLEMNNEEKTYVTAEGFGTTREKALVDAESKLREHCEGFVDLHECGYVQCEARLPGAGS